MKHKKNKKIILGNKAQVKMGETIAIMFIFFILLIVGAVFYMNIARTSMKKDIDTSYQLKAVELSQVISFLPELQCTESNVVRASCFDLYKVIGLSKVRQDPKAFLLYSREFETTKIRILQIYPPGGNHTIYENPKPDYTSAPVTNIPISVYNASSDDHYFGVLEITSYQ